MAAELPDKIELPIHSTDEDTVYRCPGEASSISREVHLARLDSGWSGCRDCVWNDARSTDVSSVRQEARGSTSIRRTESGVRGPYLNALDRFRAAQVAAILASHISRVAFVRSAVKSTPTDGVTMATATALIGIGYDGRTGSQDLFAGVVSSVMQNGCDVIDAGRCSTASLLTVCRSESNVAGCLMVTGANSKAGDVGIDVFGSDGRSLSVPWTDFGVGVRVVSSQSPADLEETLRWQPSDALERVKTNQSTPAGNHPPEDSEPILEFPSLSESTQLFRSGRSSGQLSSVESEKLYRDWLSRWWPDTVDESVCFYTQDELIQERIQSLTADSASIQFRSGRLERTAAGKIFTFVVSEDDRHLQTYSRSGKRIPAEALANWINHASRTTSSHVTAHPTNDQQNVLLVDVANPNSGRSHEIVCDALAVIGLVLTLASNPKNQFPA